MRSLLLAFVLLLPQLGWAQLFSSGKFEDGSYLLSDSPNVRHPGQLRLDNGSKLTLKTLDGTKTKLGPAQVYSFKIGQRNFITARAFRVQGGHGGFGMNVDEAFVEQLDSGQVVLMQYEYTFGGTGAMAAYLLKFAQQDEYVSVQPAAYSTAGGNHFRDAVRPFLAGHPDLLKLLDEKHLTMDNLAAVIHAINTGKTYKLPPSHYEIMKQQALAKQAKKAAVADSTKK